MILGSISNQKSLDNRYFLFLSLKKGKKLLYLSFKKGKDMRKDIIKSLIAIKQSEIPFDVIDRDTKLPLARNVENLP